jgi:hypothetical protein
MLVLACLSWTLAYYFNNYEKTVFYSFFIACIAVFSLISSYFAFKSICRLIQTGTSKDLRRLLAFRIIT